MQGKTIRAISSAAAVAVVTGCAAIPSDPTSGPARSDRVTVGGNSQPQPQKETLRQFQGPQSASQGSSGGTYVDIIAEMRQVGCDVSGFQLSENHRKVDLKIGCK